jgi:2-methylisocitrate lyase-like PEP mutase family enzyme
MQQYGIDEAIDRLKSAIEAGGDVAFLEACTKRQECENFCKELKGVPLMYGMVQGSKSYRMTAKEAKDMGYSIIVYAAGCLSPVYKSVRQALSNLKINGDCDDYSEDITPHRMFDICGMTQFKLFDEQVAATIHSNT